MITIGTETEEKLTEKQRVYSQEYLKNGYNGTQAAIAAGYKESSAPTQSTENLRKPNVIQYIKELRQHIGQNVGISKEYVLLMHKGIAEKDIPERDKVKALAEISKLLGHYEPEKVTNVNVDGDKTDIDWI